MNFFQISAVLIVMTALFSYLNYRRLHLPTTIGVMLMTFPRNCGQSEKLLQQHQED